MANPEAGAVTNEESAVERIAGLLEPEVPTPKQPEQPKQEEPEPEAEAEPVEAGEAEAEPAEEPSEEPDTTEPEEPEGEELPDTLEGLAEALNVEPADLAGHLKVPIKVNGKVEHVTLTEAMKGHQLESDYRQKTSELAEHRRQLDAQSQQAFERWQQQVAQLGEAIEQFDEAGPSAEELANLMEEDPQEYLRAVARQNARKEKLDSAKRLRDEEIQRYREQLSQQFATNRAEQQRLLQENIPDLAKPDKLREFEDGLTGFLRDRGFPDEEITGFFSNFDHRHVLIAQDAMKYRAMQEGKKTLPKKLQGKSKVLKPGVSQPKSTDTDKLVASRDRLRKLGKRGKTSRLQQEDAAIDMVKRILS